MAYFETGVASYIKTQAAVTVYFPVDFKGNADVSCNQCRFYRRQSRSCALNGEVVQYPERYVGVDCPLEEVKEDEPG